MVINLYYIVLDHSYLKRVQCRMYNVHGIVHVIVQVKELLSSTWTTCII